VWGSKIQNHNELASILDLKWNSSLFNQHVHRCLTCQSFLWEDIHWLHGRTPHGEEKRLCFRIKSLWFGFNGLVVRREVDHPRSYHRVSRKLIAGHEDFQCRRLHKFFVEALLKFLQVNSFIRKLLKVMLHSLYLYKANQGI